MSFPNAPLSYDASKAVLQHMDPNKRALLVTKCPSLRTPNSVVSQRIESVSVEPARITINNTTYKMGVLMQYPQGAALPEGLLESNNSGGQHWDVDRFGFIIRTLEVTPGDFPISVFVPKPEEEGRRGLEDRIRDTKRRRDARSEEKRKLEVRAKKKRNKGLEARLAQLTEQIGQIEAEMFAFQLKLDNNDRDIPFRFFMQLTITADSPDGQKVLTIERLQYNQDLGPATKYLFERILKKEMNYVNELRITSIFDTDRFWLPAELNLTARHLRINNHCELVLRTVGEFLHRNNRRPFKTFAFESIHFENYDVGIVNAAEKLIIIMNNPFFPFGTIRNRRVHFQFCPDYFYLLPLINYWERNGAPIGTYFTANTNPSEGSIWYSRMREREGHIVVEAPTRGCECLPDCVILPLAYNVQLEFYITPLVGQPYPSQLNLEVQPSK